jgi:hypothetical protein
LCMPTTMQNLYVHTGIERLSTPAMSRAASIPTGTNSPPRGTGETPLRGDELPSPSSRPSFGRTRPQVSRQSRMRCSWIQHLCTPFVLRAPSTLLTLSRPSPGRTPLLLPGRVCVVHADNNAKFVCAYGDRAAEHPRHVPSGLDTHGAFFIPVVPEWLPSGGTNSPPHQVARVLGVLVRKSLGNYACMPLILPAPWPACPGVPLARLPCCPAQPGEDIRISQGRPPPPRCQRCRGHAQNAAWWRMGPFHTWFGRADPTSIRAQATHLTRCGGVGFGGMAPLAPLLASRHRVFWLCREMSARKVEVILPKHLVEVYQKGWGNVN